MKASELIEGKYYRIYSISFRFLEIRNDYVCVAGYLIYNTQYYIRVFNELYSINDGYEYKEIVFTDIINYLPNNNIDKINYLRKERIKKLLI